MRSVVKKIMYDISQADSDKVNEIVAEWLSTLNKTQPDNTTALASASLLLVNIFKNMDISCKEANIILAAVVFLTRNRLYDA